MNNGTHWSLRYLETFFTQITKYEDTFLTKNYELLYSVKAHVPTHREGRKELEINGSSDLVDLGTFREDSQIDFVTGNVLCTFGGGGGLRKNVSQILAIIDFFKQINYRKNLVSKEEYYRQDNFKPNKLFKLEQIWRRQLYC